MCDQLTRSEFLMLGAAVLGGVAMVAAWSFLGFHIAGAA